MNENQFDIVKTLIDNKFVVITGFLFTILVPIYSYFSTLNTTTLFLYVLSLLILACISLFVTIIWLKNIGKTTNKLLSLTNGRLHLILSNHKIKLDYYEDSVEKEEPFYRSYGFSLAILNERHDIADVELIITKPPQVQLLSDYSKLGDILLETTNQIKIKLNLPKGVQLIDIQGIEMSNENASSYNTSNRTISFEIKGESLRAIPATSLSSYTQIQIQI